MTAENAEATAAAEYAELTAETVLKDKAAQLTANALPARVTAKNAVTTVADIPAAAAILMNRAVPTRLSVSSVLQ